MTGNWQDLLDSSNAACEKRRYPEAERILIEALKIAETFDAADLRLATTLNNLAAIYQLQGKYAFAETHYLRCLEIKKLTLGADHLDVATNLNNLAVLYSAKRKYAEAEPFYKECLRIRETILGPSHPLVASVLKNYARMLEQDNQFDEARKLLSRADEISVVSTSTLPG